MSKRVTPKTPATRARKSSKKRYPTPLHSSSLYTPPTPSEPAPNNGAAMRLARLLRCTTGI
jgi:hypothetical protein